MSRTLGRSLIRQPSLDVKLISPVNAGPFWRTDVSKMIEGSHPRALPRASFIDTLSANMILASHSFPSRVGCLEIQEVL